MFQGIKDWYAKRNEKREADGYEAVFFNDEPTTTDAVVFVHGLGGHFRDTWKKFPELLYHDPDIPRLDILLWGYNSSFLPGVNGVSTEARRLMSDMRLLFEQGEHLFFVGHSMGGLAILEGLVDELTFLRGAQTPIKLSRHIVLYATPVHGNIAAAAAKYSLGLFSKTRWMLNKQIKDLATGPFVQDLLLDVTNRIYSPTIAPGQAAGKYEIPITACVGTRDRVVSQASAKGVFSRNPPVLLDHGHFAIKEPRSRDDRRYLPLRNILLAHYSQWFRDIAANVVATPPDRRAATIVLSRCRHAFVHRLRARPDLAFDSLDVQRQEVLLREFMSIACTTAIEAPNEPFTEVLKLALFEFGQPDDGTG